MDNKMNKSAQQVNETKFLDKKIDRGDVYGKDVGPKNVSKEKVNSKNVIRRHTVFERGDTTNFKVPKLYRSKDKVVDKNKKPNEMKSSLIADVLHEVTSVVEETPNPSEIAHATGKRVGDRKVISDKPSFKGRLNTNISRDTKIPIKIDLKNDRVKNQLGLKPGSRDLHTASTSSDVKMEAENKKDKEPNRKALIKTVKSKNDNKVYKTVTFTEKKVVKPTVLEINIPNIQTKKTKTNLVDKNLEAQIMSMNNNKSTSKLSFRDKTEKSQHNRRNRLTERTKRKKLNRCISSPDKFKKAESPPTEVAKWGPSCNNPHTKPYYEAWVNTTLAAISKISRKDKLFYEKENIIKEFQKSLEDGVESPELIHKEYNNNNEFYTGKIKIKHRNAPKQRRQPLIAPLLDKDISTS